MKYRSLTRKDRASHRSHALVCSATYPQPLLPQLNSAHRTRTTPGSLSVRASWPSQTHSAGSPI